MSNDFLQILYSLSESGLAVLCKAEHFVTRSTQEPPNLSGLVTMIHMRATNLASSKFYLTNRARALLCFQHTFEFFFRDSKSVFSFSYLEYLCVLPVPFAAVCFYFLRVGPVVAPLISAIDFTVRISPRHVFYVPAHFTHLRATRAGVPVPIEFVLRLLNFTVATGSHKNKAATLKT